MLFTGPANGLDADDLTFCAVHSRLELSVCRARQHCNILNGFTVRLHIKP